LLEGQVTRKEDQFSIWDCLPVNEKAKDVIDFSGMSEEVKINQFPGLFILGRKDSLWQSYKMMQERHGKDLFNFLPRTFVVPQDREELEKTMMHLGKPMIIKPPNWFCGIGIKLINNIADIPSKKNKMCVQEYLDKPFLIKGHKFDLRLYVLLTSIDPVKIYLYEEGLVRFATAKYTNDPAEMTNNFIHLTNYSVNKTNKEQFVYNETPGDYEGHKWNLGTLWKYFEQELGLDWRPVWEKVKEVCVKTVMCGHEHLKSEWEQQVKSDYNCYKLFGFDVFFDQDLKPWLLEINNIPSLHINTIDSFVNRPMVAEMFNIVGFHIPKGIGATHRKSVMEQLGLEGDCLPRLGHDPSLYSRSRTEEDRQKEDKFRSEDMSSHEDILTSLSPSDLHTLVQAEDELSQTVSWTRVFPSPPMSHLVTLLSPPSYRDLLLRAWEGRVDKLGRREGRDLLRDILSC